MDTTSAGQGVQRTLVEVLELLLEQRLHLNDILLKIVIAHMRFCCPGLRGHVQHPPLPVLQGLTCITQEPSSEP